MDKAVRNSLRLATIACRKALEADFARQLEGVFGIGRGGTIVDESRLPYLGARQRDRRRRIVEALHHRIAGGATPEESLVRFVREAAFSTLNRLAALKLMESPARGIIVESVGSAADSRGFKQFQLISPEAIRAEADGGYRLYLELLFDDLATEIGVLFDRDAPQAALFPAPLALAEVLDRLNDPALKTIWSEDETIGWIYQYFTPKEQRDEARKASSAPRDAYELAFRNQFFTPRYVVEFLTDNTLGRTWYEMRQGETALAERPYLVRRKHPIWLAPGEAAPEPIPAGSGFEWLTWDWEAESRMWTPPNRDLTQEDIATLWGYALSAGPYTYGDERFATFEQVAAFAGAKAQEHARTGAWAGTFVELRVCLFFEQRRYRHYGRDPEGTERESLFALNRAIADRWDLEVEAIGHREKKDPRHLRILDPACGSGHFLLYAFELLLTIYDEAYDDPDLGPALRYDFPDLDAFQRSVPDLILRHNLHGVDIDLRAVQIAQLALWLRTQRAYSQLDLSLQNRPRVRRINLVPAIEMPAEPELLTELLQSIENAVVADLVEDIWHQLAGAGEVGSLLRSMGSLLKVEEVVPSESTKARVSWQTISSFRQLSLFASEITPNKRYGNLRFISDEAFWQSVPPQVWQVLVELAASADSETRHRHQLFSDDVAQGFALVELFDLPFDVVLMNPPFGAVSLPARAYVDRHYPKSKHDLYAAFVERGLDVLHPRGYLGAITSRTGFFLTSFQKWREDVILKGSQIHLVADLGQGVLDAAMVETAAYTLEKR